MTYINNGHEITRKEAIKLLGEERLQDEEKVANGLFKNGCYEYSLWDKRYQFSILPD